MEKKVNGHLVINISGMTDMEIREEVAKIIREHPRKGAINILEAKPNAELARYVKASTSFMDGLGFEFNFATRCYVFSRMMTSEESLPHCRKCGKLIRQNVLSVHKGFGLSHCSQRCGFDDEMTVRKRMRTKLEKYGDENFNNIEQTRKTCLKRYGCECCLQDEKVKAKGTETKLALYGDAHYVNSERASATKLEKYGALQNGEAISAGKRRKAAEDPEYYSRQLEKKRATNTARGLDPDWNNCEKAKATKLEKYGDENFNNHEQAKATKLERYGDENFNNVDRAEKTCMEKYGVRNYSQTDEFQEKSSKTCFLKYGAANFMQSETGRHALSERRNRETFERMTAETNRTKPLFDMEEYAAKTSDGTFRWKCTECGREFEAPVNFVFARQTGNFARCLKCHPVTFCNSKKQEELYLLVTGLVGEAEVRKNDRKAIQPKEIDVYLPAARTGFEFDGLFWHSAYWNSDMTHLSEKTKTCAEAGIALCHVFEDEWDERRAAVKDRIEGMLKGNGRSCADLIMSRAEWTEAAKFYERNSTDMFVRRSDFTYCLRDANWNAASMLSFNANAGKITVNAFQNAIGTRLGDSFKTLTDAVLCDFSGKAREMTFKADARWPDESIFEGTGFRFVKLTTPTTWLVDASKWKRIRTNVTKDTMSRFFGKEFDDRPLIDQLHDLGYSVVTDCGKKLYVAKPDVSSFQPPVSA